VRGLRPGRHQQTGEQDQGRDDGVEDVARQDQQEGAAGCRAEAGRARQPGAAPLLADQLGPVSPDGADVAEDEPDGVGDVGGDRRVADRQQHREGDERTGADDRVDRSSRDRGGEDGEGLER
jgi:hypothetical protein